MSSLSSQVKQKAKKERKGGQTSNKIDEKGVIIDVYT
jgi:hypothetical protein